VFAYGLPGKPLTQIQDNFVGLQNGRGFSGLPGSGNDLHKTPFVGHPRFDLVDQGSFKYLTIFFKLLIILSNLRII
jgi:hypothetical protein